VCDVTLIQTDDIFPASITRHPLWVDKSYFDISVGQIVRRISRVLSETTTT